MISKEDIIAMCGLTEEEVAAIAEHEHMPDVAAAAFAKYVLEQEHDPARLKEMIVDDFRVAVRARRFEHAQEIILALRHFLAEFPQARSDRGQAGPQT